MGLIMVKAFFWFLVLSAIWALFKGCINGAITLCTTIRDKVGYARMEGAEAPARAARIKQADDNLRAATARANAFIKEYDAMKAAQESKQ